MTRQDSRVLAADCRAVATRLERLAPQVSPAARELFEETARLLRDRAATAEQPGDQAGFRARRFDFFQ
jgi:hypothetical protein